MFVDQLLLPFTFHDDGEVVEAPDPSPDLEAVEEIHHNGLFFAAYSVQETVLQVQRFVGDSYMLMLISFSLLGFWYGVCLAASALSLSGRMGRFMPQESCCGINFFSARESSMAATHFR